MSKVDSLKKLLNSSGETVCEVLNNAEPSKEILIKSSTPDSTKIFKITVVDAGTITATEVTNG